MSNVHVDAFLNSLDKVPEKMMVSMTITLKSGNVKTNARSVNTSDLGNLIDACRALFDDADVKQVIVGSASKGSVIWDSEVERQQMTELYGSKIPFAAEGKPLVEPMDPQQCYLCLSGAQDQLVVYPTEEGVHNEPSVAFICESANGQRDHFGSTVIKMDDVRRLRNQLNQLLGE